MNSRSLVFHMLNGMEIEEEDKKIPAGFWFHFKPEIVKAGVESQVKAHIDFYNSTKVDILKIMNENEFRQKHKIESPDDWKQIQPLSYESELFVNQEKINREIVSELSGDVFLLGTVHGIMASLSHSSGHSYSHFPEVFMEQIALDEEAVKKAIYNTYLNVLKMMKVTEKSGVDGIYYAMLGAERDKLPEDIYRKYILPYDMKIAEQCDIKFFLHVCKENTDLNRIKDIDFDVINWAIHETDFTIAQVQQMFPEKFVLGGFDDRTGVLVDGTNEQIASKLNSILDGIDVDRFMLGADCTLPTDIEYSKVRYVMDLLEDR